MIRFLKNTAHIQHHRTNFEIQSDLYSVDDRNIAYLSKTLYKCLSIGSLIFVLRAFRRRWIRKTDSSKGFGQTDIESVPDLWFRLLLDIKPIS